jgi:hypothetical protein
MINATQGYSAGFIFTDNYCRGGNYFVNGGGNANPGGAVNLGDFLRNMFIDDQGNYGSSPASGTGHTLDFGGTWSGNVNAPVSGANKNYYYTGTIGVGSPITVRT